MSGAPSKAPSAAASFFADPMSFMADNIIVVGFEGGDTDTLTSTPLDLCLAKRMAAGGRAMKLGRELGLYAIGTAGFLKHCVPNVESISPSFKAYFCPYRGGSTLGTMVANDADCMFTTQMDGCSLGIGSAAPDGSRLVYHSNVGGNAPAQETMLNTKMGGAVNIETIWAPKSYRFEFGMAELCATSFGIRNPKSRQWSFFSQTYQRAYSRPDKFYLREVKKVL
jgi:hypothetical protein